METITIVAWITIIVAFATIMYARLKTQEAIKTIHKNIDTYRLAITIIGVGKYENLTNEMWDDMRAMATNLATERVIRWKYK